MTKEQRAIIVNAEIDGADCEIAIDWAVWGLKYGRDILAIIRDLEAENAALRDAINETLELADFLNGIAERGGGFCEHWGERVLQAVEPLRDVEAFASKTLEHNRTLLEHNGKLTDEVAALREYYEAAEAWIERSTFDKVPPLMLKKTLIAAREKVKQCQR